MTAENIRLSDDVLNSIFNIAASSKKINLVGDGDELQQGNQENARAIYELLNKSDLKISAGLTALCRE